MAHPLTRRSLLALAGAASSSLPSRAFQQRAVRLGGPVFLKSEDPVALAKEHRRLGYSAAYCPKAKAEDSAHVAAISKAFAAENVAIAEVGAWVNMLDPDSEKRRANLNYVIERMALAEAVGARCCVDYAGSFNPKIPWGPDRRNLSDEFFEATVENCRKIVDAVQPGRSVFSIEMMGWNLPDSPDAYVKLVKAVDRKSFAVHMDVCNGINSPRKFYENAKFIDECFNKLGPWIVSCHAKDLEWIPELNVHFLEVVPGRGSVDYRAYLTALAKLPVDAPLMLEHLKTAEEYDEGRAYIQGIARQAGVSLA
ncbi:MAG: sugar phosphate isomerase/epimerase [Acidobacteriota bacterium]|nr:sugar phosphate isomerase/epimerase [Acidobacteriota bacterium]